jgi:peptide/nickel transport system substrate-binding protein
MSTSSNDIRISFNIFDNLTSRRPDGKLLPGLATEWKLQGQTTWAFKLRPGVKWHNGDAFSSADVKFSVDRSLDKNLKGNRVSTVLTTVDRVETPDPATVLIHTKKPDPLLPARLGFYGGQMIPKKYVESAGADKFNLAPVGTGPLRFVSWTKDDRIVLGRIRTTGAAGSTSTDSWSGPCPKWRLASRPCSRARSISSRRCRPTRASGSRPTPPPR